jgi:hypothetical protein
MNTRLLRAWTISSYRHAKASKKRPARHKRSINYGSIKAFTSWACSEDGFALMKAMCEHQIGRKLTPEMQQAMEVYEAAKEHARLNP